jgi:hypothetical protein
MGVDLGPVARRPAQLEVKVAAFLPAEVAQSAPHHGEPRLAFGIRLAAAPHQEADAPHAGGLRVRRCGRKRRARGKCQNVPPSHAAHPPTPALPTSVMERSSVARRGHLPSGRRRDPHG